MDIKVIMALLVLIAPCNCVLCHNCVPATSRSCVSPESFSSRSTKITTCKVIKGLDDACFIRFGEYGRFNETLFHDASIFKRFGRGCWSEDSMCRTGVYICCRCFTDKCNSGMKCSGQGVLKQSVLMICALVLFVVLFG